MPPSRPPFDAISALGTNQIDVIFGPFENIEGVQLESLGVEMGYFHLGSFGIPNFHDMIVVANGLFLKENPGFK